MSCPTPLELSQDESVLFEKVCAGAKHDANRACISAEAIRHMLLGLTVIINGQPLTPRAPQGVRLVNAIITGHLDLRNAKLGDCCPLPALVMEDCTIREEINLTCTLLARLSLQDSRITCLKAIECLIDGPVNLERITSAEDLVDEGDNPIQGGGMDGWGLCAVDFAGSLINGSFFANGAQCFVGPDRPEVACQSGTGINSVPCVDTTPNSAGRPWKTPYALNLRSCHIKGSILLENRFLAYGGVSLIEAHIEGDVWARGATLCAAHGDAFRSQSTLIEGSLILRECPDQPNDPRTTVHPFQSEGNIDLYGAKINNNLDMSGARLVAGQDNEASLDATSLQIGQVVFLDKIHSDIPINLHGARIAMSLQMVAANLKRGINATNTKIGGEVVLAGDNDNKKQFHAVGKLEFWDADIALSFRLESAELDGLLVMNDARVGRELKIFDSKLGELQAKRVRVDGNVQLESARLHDLLMDDAKVGREFKIIDSKLRKLHAKGVRVDGNVKLTSSGLKRNDSPVVTEVYLDDAQIGADLELTNFLFERQKTNWASYTVLSLREACVDGALKVYGIGLSSKVAVQSAKQRALRLPFYQRNLPFLSRLRNKRWYLVEDVSNGTHGSYLWDGKNRVRHLNGSSAVIHDMNEAQHLVLTKDDVGLYLRFFCGHTHGAEGPFRLIGTGDLEYLELSNNETICKAIRKAVDAGVQEVDETFISSSVFLYGKDIFLADFRVFRDGSVEMVDDTHLTTEVVTNSSKYSQDHGAMFGSWEEWSQAAATKAETFNSALTKKAPVVDLTHAQATRLDDNDGLAWGTDFSMKLEGFIYRQSSRTAPEDEHELSGDVQMTNSPVVRSRLVDYFREKYRAFRGYPPARIHQSYPERHQKRGCWLFLQYEEAEPTARHFSLQPFEVAAAAYRRDGHADEAWRIRSYTGNARFHTRHEGFILREPKNFFLASLWMLLVSVKNNGLMLFRNIFWRASYDYGRSFGGAVSVIIALLALGIWGVNFANHSGLLVVDAPVTVKVLDSPPGLSTQAMRDTGAVATTDETVTSYDACGDSINEWIYATDLLIPLVDLGEESRCRVRGPTRDDAGKNWYEHPTAWGIFKGIYEILGWIIISLAIVIRTGVFEQLANTRGARFED